MRILFFTHYFPPEGNAPAVRVHEMARRWVAAGHEVTVVTCAPNVPGGVVYEGYENRLRQTETIDGIEVVRLWTYIAPNKGTVRRIINYLSFMVSATCCGLFVRRPDVVIATSPQFFCGWAGLLVSVLRRVPFILEIRDIWPESIVAVGAITSRAVIGPLEFLERRLYAGADHIVTVGTGYSQKLADKDVPKEKLSVVTNGVDVDAFAPTDDAEDLRRKFGLANRKVISYVGTIGMAAGLEVVLEAAERLAAAGREDVVFLLVGDGARREALESEARQRGLANVVFTGRQPRERVPGFIALSTACLVHLKKCDLFKTVLPSKVFEAAAIARPILLGVEGCAADELDGAGAGLCFEPENADALVESIKRIADDPALCRKLGENGRAWILESYSRDQLAADYLEVIEGVVGRDRPGRDGKAGSLSDTRASPKSKSRLKPGL